MALLKQPPSNIDDIAQSNMKRAAAALTRMLMHAELDALDLGDPEIARRIREAADLTRSTYSLTERDLYRS